MARYIRAMNKDEQDKLFDEVEKDDNLKRQREGFCLRRVTGTSTTDSPNYVDIHRTVTCDAENTTMLCPAKLVTERETTIDYEGKIQITTEH
jgi:hypothetical protein